MASQVRDIKVIRFGGIPVMVDGFAFSTPFIKHYFLTHCHSDHTIGLRTSFSGGYIYCSEVAANLLLHDMGLKNRSVVKPLKLHETVTILNGVEGKHGRVDLRVTPLSANHSPDAVMFVFDARIVSAGDRVKETRVVHTGDFRFSEDMIVAADGFLKQKPVDSLYLDTTYLNKRYCFPTQEAVVVHISLYIRQCLIEEPKTLFAFMSYHIGKERAYFGVAERLNMRIYVTPKKRKVLELLNLPDRWTRLITERPTDANIHVGGRVNEENVAEDVKKLGLKRGVIVRPTGWSFSKSSKASVVHTRPSSHNVTIASAPYSEHSSYEEIKQCVKILRPKKIIPTVNAETEEQRRRMVEKELLELMDLSSDRCRIDSYFSTAHSGRNASPDDSKRKVVDLTVSPRHCTNAKRAKDPEVIDLGTVDVEEQRRLFEELENAKMERKGSSSRKLSPLELFFRKNQP
jgi:mRNA degradation ribonuclease J1/J2